ncbi:hypothetical protein [Parapedobacter deserti]
MIINYVFTGIFAAAMLVPGTGQREVTKAGEEPVVKEHETVKGEEPMYWYQTNEAGTHTDGSTPFFGTRSQALQAGCSEDAGIVCLYGSDQPDLPANTPVGTPTADQAIFKAN